MDARSSLAASSPRYVTPRAGAPRRSDVPVPAPARPVPGGVGSTQKDPARFASLIDDVEERLFGALPDEAWVYPGHGRNTTIGAELPHLGEWRARGGEFLKAASGTGCPTWPPRGMLGR